MTTPCAECRVEWPSAGLTHVGVVDLQPGGVYKRLGPVLAEGRYCPECLSRFHARQMAGKLTVAEE